jgi:nicotinamidase/pyrazinamidase
MPTKIRLLIIDPQIDFCSPTGALYVPGAEKDMSRLAAMIHRIGAKIDDIDVTLDSHHPIDIAHPGWWINSKGANPAPFTLITASDVAAGIWSPRNPGFRKRSLEYVQKLEAANKFVLIIWPEHCLIGSPGHAVQPELFKALRDWEVGEFGVVNVVTKGSNIFTEHYSAVAAEVPDPQDPSTMLNARLITSLQESDVVLIAGEALSHCVKATVEDIADNIGAEHVRKFVFLEDCSSSIPASPGAPDFPTIARDFLDRMKARGMTVTTSTEFLSGSANASI